MAHLVKELWVHRLVEEVFDFFCRPANLIQLAPPELHLRLLDGPERLHLGAALTFKGRRWGVAHRATSAITRFEAPRLFVEEQRRGPFRRWVHTHRFEPVADGTRIVDEVDYEGPGGMLGLVVTAAALEKDLEWVFGFRADRLRALLGA